MDEIRRIQLSRNLDARKTLQITFDAFSDFTNFETFKKSLETNYEIFSYFTNDKNNEYSTLLFFGVLEEIIARRNREEFLGKTYKIIFTLWDKSIVNDDQILEWAESATDAPYHIVDKDEADEIQEKAKPFIEWLQEEEDEEDEEEEEEG